MICLLSYKLQTHEVKKTEMKQMDFIKSVEENLTQIDAKLMEVEHKAVPKRHSRRKFSIFASRFDLTSG